MSQEVADVFLRIHQKDNVAVALQDLKTGTQILLDGLQITTADIKAKHKFTLTPLQPGDEVIMYGVLVGKATEPIALGGLITVNNIVHASADFKLGERKSNWQRPDISK